MNILKKYGSVVGAVAIAGAMSLGFAGQAAADLNPSVAATVTPAAGTPEFSVSVTGCSVADGVESYEANIIQARGVSYIGKELTEGEVQAPASGAIELSGLTEFPGEWVFQVFCHVPGSDVTRDAEVRFNSTVGLLNLVGANPDGTWEIGGPTTINSYTVPILDGGEANAFDPNSPVTFTVTGPDGTSQELEAATADANGALKIERVLPFTVDGTYTITATGTRDGAQVVLYNTYQQVNTDDDDDSTPAPDPSNPEEKPKSLPKTGIDGLDMAPIAALISGITLVGLAASRKR